MYGSILLTSIMGGIASALFALDAGAGGCSCVFWPMGSVGGRSA